MSKITLEDVIRQNIPLPGAPSSTGWHSVLCKVCNDHGNKGLRGGFKFDGEVTAYHCFNCGPEMNTSYDPERDGGRMPKKMKRMLADFAVPEDEWQQVTFDNMSLGSGSQTKDEHKLITISEPPVLQLPSYFYPLKDDGDAWSTIAREYLKLDRGVDPDSYPFYLAKNNGHPEAKFWTGRVIIPIFKDGNLIYYQGRDLTGARKRKYLSPTAPKDIILHGFDKLHQSDKPLYVVEGWFDAYPIDGVAILGNEFSETHIRLLKRAHRQIVYVPDKFGDGERAALVAIKNGFSISTPDISDCKDINDAVLKFGKLYVIKTLIENTTSGFPAEVNLGLYCKS